MTETESAQSSSVILDRDEWEAFTADVRRLAQAYEALIVQSRQKYTSAAIPAVQKEPLGARILRFLRLKKGISPTSYDSQYASACPHCGADHEAGEAFCRICGRRLLPER